MLQQEQAEDYVVGTGESHSVREFLEHAFGYAGIGIEWKGRGVRQKGIIKSVNRNLLSAIRERNQPQVTKNGLRVGDPIIEIDPKYFRPTEVDFLKADISKARKKLGWQPRTTFDELVKIMVDYDMKLIGLKPVGEGIKICKKKGFTYTRHDLAKYEKIRERC
jgi:GDPmannose 4,6-dehydratase